MISSSSSTCGARPISLEHHRLEMLAGQPQTDEDHGDQRPGPLVPQQGEAGDSEDDRLRRGDSGDLEEGLLALGQQVEDPDSQRQVGVDQVGKPQDDEVDGQGEGLHPEEGGGPGQGRPGNGDSVRLESTEKADERRDRPPHPHGRAPEEAVDQTVGFLAPDHRQPHLHDGIGEPFPLHPLAPQDDHDRHHRHVQGQQENRPPEQRLDPGAVRDVPFPHPLVEQDVACPVIDDGAPVEVREQPLRPLVLRRGVVEESADHPRQLLAHPHGAESGDDQHHRIDEDQLGPVESEAAAPRHGNDVGQRGQHQQTGEEEAGGVRIEGVERLVRQGPARRGDCG